MLKALRFIGIPLALLGIIGSSLLGLSVATAQSGPGPTLKITAGLGTGTVAVEDFVGDPALGGNVVRVAVGTTVTWTIGSDEFHTVTFPAGNPVPDYFVPQPEDAARPGMINPALMRPSLPVGPWDGKSFIHAELPSDAPEISVTFGEIGKYDYLCLFHPAMTAAVEVVAAGTAGITTQAAVDGRVATHMSAVHDDQIATILAERSAAAKLDGPRGTNIWMVRAGTDWRGGHLDLEAFLPKSLVVAQGDTVIWYVDHLTPHTVTFPPVGGPRPDFIRLQFPDGRSVSPPPPGETPPPEIMALLTDPATAPRLVLGPAAIATSNSVYNGQDLYSSGLFGEHPRVGFHMDKFYSLTFNTAGTFSYYCGLHEDLGMNGTLTVQPR